MKNVPRNKPRSTSAPRSEGSERRPALAGTTALVLSVSQLHEMAPKKKIFHRLIRQPLFDQLFEKLLMGIERGFYKCR